VKYNKDANKKYNPSSNHDQTVKKTKVFDLFMLIVVSLSFDPGRYVTDSSHPGPKYITACEKNIKIAAPARMKAKCNDGIMPVVNDSKSAFSTISFVEGRYDIQHAKTKTTNAATALGGGAYRNSILKF
jgi:hypothetical protein